MVRSIAADLAKISRVVVLRDVRCLATVPNADCHPIATSQELHQAFGELAQRAAATILIAPEFDHHLLTLARRVEEVGGRLLGPHSAFIGIAASKHSTAQLLAQAGVPVPFGILAGEPTTLDPSLFPAVLKPDDGAGSVGIRLCESQEQAVKAIQPGRRYRLERYCPGQAISVSVLCGPCEVRVLPACTQRLSGDGTFCYLGGEVPVPRALNERAQDLAMAVVSAFPRTCGYFGIDMVLGEDPQGSADAVIEVNPRITTSYLGLRQIVRPNLGLAMWNIARGMPVELSFAPGPVQFAANEVLLDRSELNSCSGWV